MQTRLLNSLDEQGADDPKLREELERRSYKGKQVRINAAEPSGTAPAPAPVIEPPKPQAGPPKPVVEVLTGESATGWDVDLYWCQGAQEGDHYRLARSLGDYFAEISRSGRSIGPGVTLGQIRTRPADANQFARLGFPAPGNWIIWDSGPGEQAAAQALRQAAGNSALPGAADVQPIHSNGKPTRWRLSAFVCSGTPFTRPRGG
jgi:hypothetical protein